MTVVDLVVSICPIIAEAEILHKIDKVAEDMTSAGLKQLMMVMLNSNWLDFLPAGRSLPSCKQGGVLKVVGTTASGVASPLRAPDLSFCNGCG